MNQDPAERSVESLIRLAGARDMPSAEGVQRARQAAEQAWQRTLEQNAKQRAPRRRALASLGFALAAGIAALAVFGWRQMAVRDPAVLVAQVAVLDGKALLRAGDSQVEIVEGMPLHAGATLIAVQGRVAISLGDAMSLRLNRGAHLRLEDPDRVTLLAGELYVDSGGINVASALRIATPAGDVRHVGTQFLVTVSGGATRVRVREGRVLLAPSSGGTAFDLSSGDELEYRGGEARWRRDLPSYGPDWDWSAGVAPLFDAENRPLSELLDWLVRQQGWHLRYASEALQEQARDIRLHGSFERLDAGTILERVAWVTGLSLVVRDGVLWVQSPS